jgi:hypothetical protein
MQFPQVDICADRARLAAGEQMFGLRFKNHSIADGVQRSLFCRDWTVVSDPQMLLTACSSSTSQLTRNDPQHFRRVR